MRRPTLIQIRITTALIVGTYVTMHLLNHALGLISVDAQETARPLVMWIWHSWIGQIALYGSIATHAVLGLYSLARRRHFRMPIWEATQLILGLTIPYFLFLHIVNTRGTRILSRIDIDYVYEIAALWVTPTVRYKQIALVMIVWVHFIIGLHFWLRIRPWYRRAFGAMVLFYALVPMFSLLGFAQVGMKMTSLAQADKTWLPATLKKGTPTDPQRAKVRTNLRNWVGPSWVGAVIVVLCAAQLRNLLERGRQFAVTYPRGQVVRAPVGMSLLEVSRMSGLVHMSVCGGRARCTTCRVRVLHAEGDLPPPTVAETRALARIGAPPNLRLACQTRPQVDVAVQPLLHPGAMNLPQGPGGNEAEFGLEKYVTVLFLDVRGSAALAEKRLPYDVVFLFNHFFAEMTAAVDAAQGHYSNFTGDGLMALFGLGNPRLNAARAALNCAVNMLQRLEAFNQRLRAGFEKPIEIGLGIHTGLAIVGRMGPPKTPLLTALGDTINTASRLEELSKELVTPIIVSADTLGAAGIRAKVPMREVQLRGRNAHLRIALLDGRELNRLLTLPDSGIHHRL